MLYFLPKLLVEKVNFFLRKLKGASIEMQGQNLVKLAASRIAWPAAIQTFGWGAARVLGQNPATMPGLLRWGGLRGRRALSEGARHVRDRASRKTLAQSGSSAMGPPDRYRQC